MADDQRVQPAVIDCEYVNARPVVSRGIWQVVLEIPAESAREFLMNFDLPTPSTKTVVALANVPAAGLSINEHGKLRQDLRASVEAEKKGGKLAERAGILCSEPAFRQFLRDMNRGHVADADEAADELRVMCGISSRVELDHNPEAAARFRDLKASYEAWCRI